MLAAIVITILGLTSVLLFAFGVNLLYLTSRAARLRPSPPGPYAPDGEPLVCVQVPIYNERYVAERVLDAVCAIDWPASCLEVQVLDDSDDETTAIIARRAARWRRDGIKVTHVRRGKRAGFKAGALAFGLTLTNAPFIAIFDADFVPANDFLRRTMGVFDDPVIGFVQARWGHLDEGYSWFTRLQALVVDFHFLVEQAARSAAGYFTNFTGTAGVWRRAAIEDAGGWTAATLTEDLDLSYRAQLRGWRAAYMDDVVVPEELPVSIDAYRHQQSRWATGSFQCAFELLGQVLRSPNRAAIKFQATVHLLAYAVGPMMLIQIACYPILILTVGRYGLPWPLANASILAILIGVSPWIGFMVAQTRRGRPWWSGAYSLLFQVVGAGMSITVLIALLRATRRGGEFVRTPKHRIVERGQEWRDQAYVRVGDPRALIEAALGLGALLMVAFALDRGLWLVAIYASMFALGFLVLASLSLLDLLEVLTFRALGRRALARLQASVPKLGLLALCAVLLVFAAQMAEPFEDGYAHWLIAANLASTGSLHDPLFGMEDTWLPGYHLLAAAVLRVFGLWQLGALKILGALLGTATLACVYALAPNVRQARLAVALLVLNPVFLFTSGSAVAEPLLTVLLTSAALAAVRRQMKLAALLAALACATSAKAWIWVAAAGGYAVFELWRRRAPAWGRPAIAWAVPAIGLLLFFQLGFAPASHSVARGSLEVVSATVRGSLPAGGMARVAELIRTFGLAALPLFAFGGLGLWNTVRRPGSEKERSAIRFLHAPAIVFLAAVVGLVAIGAYSGSHRYLYPALPSLALLAAAALDRYRAAVRVAAIASTGLLAIAFLPVFTGFAADNAGLVAAGRATSGSSGLLVTDSPVVAFFSGRRPADITGSQQLPLDSAAAIDWMREHDVTELVVENISYYHATVLFPELASGRPSPPFASLGQQSRYQVSGGKTVYAYRLGAALSRQSIFPGVDASIEPTRGVGKTAPLAKGVMLRVAGADATGEGVGFGVPIVRYDDGWVYSRTSNTVDLSTPGVAVWKRTFQLDEIGGDAAHGYSFVPIASRGTIDVTYTVDATGVSIDVRPVRLAPGFSQVGILNEQSAAFDDFADSTQRLFGPDFPDWISVEGSWGRLRSANLGVEWSAPSLPGAQMHAGRELIGTEFDWAGLDYLFPSTFGGATYHLNIQEAR
ncbi:MAG TPA: glycosyltransferase [Verrucomicrobiae bacterium]|nr:glycosyltransferase [Verrucomicrobiae bacterium]